MSSTRQRPAANKGSTATPVGWSLWATTLRCWYEFFLRYVKGLQPVKTEMHFTLGSAYHALLAGKSPKQVARISPEFAAVVEEAVRLYKARTSKSAPPMPEKFKPEELLIPTTGPLAGVYSTRPDRTEFDEQWRVREFKTAKAHYENADLQWQVHGEVIGELYVSGLEEAIVDVLDKGPTPTVRQYQVQMTPRKRETLEYLITDLHRQLKERWKRMNAEWRRSKKDRDAIAAKHFPRNPQGCVPYGKPCTYYELCWGENAEHRFRRVEKKEWRKRLL